MDVATIANVATALTLIAGVGFGLVEAHRSRRLRKNARPLPPFRRFSLQNG